MKKKFIVANVSFILSSGCVDRETSLDDHIPSVKQRDLNENDFLLCEEGDNSDAVDACSGDEIYRHPLQNLQETPEGFPFLDIKDSPGGGRYTILEGFEAGENATVRRVSGVYEFQSAPLTESQRTMIASAKGAGGVEPQAVISRPKISPALQVAVDAKIDSNDEQPLRVMVRAARTPTDTIQLQMKRAVAMGLIQTNSDALKIRSELMAARKSQIASDMSSLAALVQASERTVVYQCDYGHCLTVELSASMVETVAASDLVTKLDLDDELSENVGMDGALLNEVMQTQQFEDFDYPYGGYTYHFDGENNTVGYDITFAITELGGYYINHRAFYEGSGSTPRIRGGFYCTSTACGTTTFPTVNSHATGTLAGVMGDLRDSQDSSYTTAASQLARSSIAGESQGWLYEVTNLSSAQTVSWNHITSRSPAPALVSSSIASETTDPTCTGESASSEDVNEILYESGILQIIAAGNEGGSATNCEVEDPGAAIGVFTVGGHNTSYDYTDACEARSDTINSASAWGGNATEGKSRTIIDATAPYLQRLRPSSTGSYGNFGGTSIAAPSVSSAAIAFIDMYTNTYGSNIDDPGNLYANLLLMGDREGETGKIAQRYDKRWGAGRLRMRMTTPAGLDYPEVPSGVPIYLLGEICIDHGTTYTYQLNGGSALSNDLDALKFVAYWYDPGFTAGSAVDDIDIAIREIGGNVLQYSYSGPDNKERVYYPDVGNKAIQVEITGFSVSGNYVGCGTNSMRVHWALIVEDNDREGSADQPAWNSTTCSGVAKESE